MCGRLLTYVLYEIRETKLKTCDAFLLEEKPKRSYIVTLLAIFPLEFHFGQVWEGLFGLVLQTFLRFTCLMSYFSIVYTQQSLTITTTQETRTLLQLFYD